MTPVFRQVLSTKSEELKTKLQSTKYLSNLDIKERVTYLSGSLVDEKWIPWYCKAYRELGEHKYTAIVSMAKQGDNPRTLLGWLLKQELAKLV